MELSREELEAILSRKDLTEEEKEAIRAELEDSFESDEGEMPTIQEIEDILENGDLSEEERGQLEDMLTDMVMAQNDDSDNQFSDRASDGSEVYSKADLQRILDTEDMEAQEREALEMFIGTIEDDDASETEQGPKIVELNSEDESDNCVDIKDVNALIESEDIDESEKMQLKRFIDRREEEKMIHQPRLKFRMMKKSWISTKSKICLKVESLTPKSKRP